MKLAYVDTSCLVAIAFDEPGSRRLARRLESYDRLVASNLLEAELRSALIREKTKNNVDAMLFLTLHRRQRQVSAALGFAG